MRNLKKLIGQRRMQVLSSKEKEEVYKIAQMTVSSVDLPILDLVIREEVQPEEDFGLESLREGYRKQLIDARQVYLAVASISIPRYRKIYLEAGLLTEESLQCISNNTKFRWPVWLRDHYNKQIKHNKNYRRIYE